MQLTQPPRSGSSWAITDSTNPPPSSSSHPSHSYPRIDTAHHLPGPSDPRLHQARNPPQEPSSKPGRKRKKQFKYLLDLKQDPSASTPEDPANDVNNGAGTEAKKESRKKVKKACIFCKRSHMPCEEARPCKRCVKRGISDMCRDAEQVNDSSRPTVNARDKKRADSSSSTAEPPLSPSHHFFTPGISARDPDFTPMMPISVLLSPAVVDTKRTAQAPIFADAHLEQRQPRIERRNSASPPPPPAPPRRPPDPKTSIMNQAEQLPNAAEHQALAWNHGMDHKSHSELLRLLEAGPTALDLNDIFGDKPTSLLSAPSMAGLQVGDPLLMPSSANSPAADSSSDEDHYPPSDSRHPSGSRRPSDSWRGAGSASVSASHSRALSRPRNLVQEELATTAELRGIKSYSYTYGYAKLARWIQTRYTREHCQAVDRSLSQIRPKFLAISRSLPESELLGVEESFIRLVHHYQANVLECVPLPMLVTRRTGEIYGGNEHLCKTLQLPRNLLEGGQISHFQLTSEEDSVALWDMYVKECMGVLKDPPSRVCTIEVDRSLLLFNTPGFDPHTGEVFGDGSGTCPDGSPAVIRWRALVTFEAKISQHGLPIMICGTFQPIPDDLYQA